MVCEYKDRDFSSIHLENGHECLGRNLHAADLSHPLLAFLLFFEQLFLTRDITAVAFGQHILTHRLGPSPAR